jgi:hypothetical protein
MSLQKQASIASGVTLLSCPVTLAMTPLGASLETPVSLFRLPMYHKSHHSNWRVLVAEETKSKMMIVLVSTTVTKVTGVTVATE